MDQIYAFVITIIIGMLAGLIFDLYRVMVKLLKLKKVGIMLGDLIFWLVLTPVVFLTLLLGNWGEVRLYVVLGLTLGAAVYLNLFSGYILPLINRMVEIIKKFFGLMIKGLKLIWQLLCWPFRIMLMIFTVPLSFVGGIISKLCSMLGRLFNISIKAKAKNCIVGLKSVFKIK